MPEAMRPGLTLREALLNSSLLDGLNGVYRACRAVRPSMNALKNKPMPTTVDQWLAYILCSSG